MADSVTVTVDTAVLDMLLAGALDAGLGQIVASAGGEVEKRAKASMYEAKTGRIYVRRGIAHQASAPGEAPAVDIGALAGSANTAMAGPLEAHIGASVEYAEYLEKEEYLNRPFLRPALEAEREPFTEKVRRFLAGIG